MRTIEVLIELSFEDYYHLLANCGLPSKEHAIVRKAVFIQDPGDRSNRRFLIRCELPEAETLLATAKQYCPEVVYEIEKAVALARRA